MGIALIVLLVLAGFVIVGLILYFVSIYNGLVRLNRDIDKNWSNIDVMLKQRHDEIGKLVKVCEGYMKYERETLEKITSLRTDYMRAGSVEEKGKIDGAITGALKTIFAVAENYPDLKTNNNFMQLQTRISEIENNIADRRELYNDSVNVYNIRIHQIPDMVVAGMMNYKDKTLFEVSEEERRDVNIKFEFPK
ncbi:MAG: LemA family protein [Candidatus Omnitrophica bacterium]|nr:LemA family protein [Candidatus Omnitrophota bacterium]